VGERVTQWESGNNTKNSLPILKYHQRNEAQNRTDCLFIILFFGILLYPTVLQPFVFYTSFIFWFIIDFILYSILFEICERMTKLTLTAKLLTNPIGLIIVVMSCGIVGGFIYHHMFCVIVESNGFVYHSGFWGSIVAQGVFFFYPADNVKLHIHHYYWPLSLLQLCVFVSSEVSLITASMLCAISMHGIAFFGVQPLIYDVDKQKVT
jgi:hypothetical protein